MKEANMNRLFYYVDIVVGTTTRNYKCEDIELENRIKRTLCSMLSFLCIFILIVYHKDTM